MQREVYVDEVQRRPRYRHRIARIHSIGSAERKDGMPTRSVVSMNLKMWEDSAPISYPGGTMQPQARVVVATIATIGLIAACGAAESTTGSESTESSTTGLPTAYAKFGSTVTVTLDGDYAVVRANGVPDHKSVYFARTDSRYEAYNGTNSSFSTNGFQIVEQQLSFRIPLNPKAAASHASTPLGPIGIAVNGVPIFNQYNGQNRPLTAEINSFDQYNGHPQMTGQYHYHVEPLGITQKSGSSALIGFLLDGFPVYGPIENGKRITNADLDELHGHVGVTADYAKGIYHYHGTTEDPYINGAGFYGTPGTLGR